MRAVRLLFTLSILATLPLLAQQTAEQQYKNITALKGTPADQLVPAMQFMNAALGVECTFCHVQNKMDVDDKKAKKTAREMIAMTAELNKASFGGRPEITCFTCHNGASHPTNLPPVQAPFAGVNHPARPAAAAPVSNPPTAQQVLERYVTAAGGEAAIRKIASRHLKGVIEAGGQETPIDVFTKAPNKRISITHSQQGDSITAFDGSTGWLGNTGRAPRAMSPAESWAASLDAEFYLPLRIKEMFQQLRPGRPAQVNGFDCDTLTASSPDRPPVRLFFDKQTGLLARMVRYADTPLGRNVTQVDYSDYRMVEGVMTPHRWTLARPNGRFAIQVAEVKNNVDIDDQKFVKPEAPGK